MLSPIPHILFYIYFMITLPFSFIYFFVCYYFIIFYYLYKWQAKPPFIHSVYHSVLSVQANQSFSSYLLFPVSVFCPKSLLQMCILEKSKTRSVLLHNPVRPSILSRLCWSARFQPMTSVLGWSHKGQDCGNKRLQFACEKPIVSFEHPISNLRIDPGSRR